jgi:hypothetical protein
MKISKTKAERIHAKRRIGQRFNISLNRDDLNKLINSIQNNSAIFFDKQSGNRTRWIVNINNMDVIAVYNKNTKQIVTFLRLFSILPLSRYNPYLSGHKHDGFEEGKLWQRDQDQILFDKRLSNKNMEKK